MSYIVHKYEIYKIDWHSTKLFVNANKLHITYKKF